MKYSSHLLTAISAAMVAIAASDDPDMLHNPRKMAVYGLGILFGVLAKGV